MYKGIFLFESFKIAPLFVSYTSYITFIFLLVLYNFIFFNLILSDNYPLLIKHFCSPYLASWRPLLSNGLLWLSALKTEILISGHIYHFSWNLFEQLSLVSSASSGRSSNLRPGQQFQLFSASFPRKAREWKLQSGSGPLTCVPYFPFNYPEGKKKNQTTFSWVHLQLPAAYRVNCWLLFFLC